jgi:hypothetical protein
MANEDNTVRLADLINGCNVGMRDCRRRTRLAQEPGPSLLVADDVGGQDFQRNRATEVLVFGSVDHTHPALANLGEDSEVGKGPPFHRRSSTYGE